MYGIYNYYNHLKLLFLLPYCTQKNIIHWMVNNNINALIHASYIYSVRTNPLVIFAASDLRMREGESEQLRVCVQLSDGDLGNDSAAVELRNQDGSATG